MAVSYKDPRWDTIEAKLEAEYGLPKGGMRAIRVRGERSNSDQVSPVGARTVYQIMPDTRRLFQKAYGVDAYSGDEGAARVAALHLRDDMKKYGSWEAAVTRYIGGPDKSKWGKQTRAYTRRVTGRSTAGDGYSAQGERSSVMRDYSGDWLRGSPHGRAQDALYLGPEKKTHEEKRRATNKARFGGENLSTIAAGPVDKRAVGVEAIRSTEIELANEEVENRKITAWDRLKAGWQDNALTASILRNFDRDDVRRPEAGFVDHYMKNREEIEKDMDDDERTQLREATSIEHLAQIQKEIADTRERRSLYQERGVDKVDSVLFSIIGGIADPVGIVAGEGVGALFRTVGIGARALYMSGKYGRGTMSQSLEYAIGNVAVTGGMDLAGDYTTSKDYAISAGFGGAMGLVAAPFHIRGAMKDRAADQEVTELLEREADNARREYGELFDRAEANLGANATPEQVAQEAARLDRSDHMDAVKIALADQPDEVKILNGENVLTRDEAVLNDITERYDLGAVSDDTERSLVAEMIARSERGMELIPVDEKRLNPATRWFGAQSTGIDLLRSKSPVLRFFGSIATEGTTGAAGRRRTAAMAQHVRERVYNSELSGYMGLYHMYRKERGVGLAEEALEGKVFAQFERDVFMEIEARGRDDYMPNENAVIREAADKVESGMDKMRIEQQHVQTAGNARLGETSKGYIPHKLSSIAVLKLTNTQRKNVRRVLAEQFQDEANAFQRKDGTTRAMDAEFSERLAAKYLERAMDKAKGGYDVPMNLQDPQAADMLWDALEGMGLTFPEIKDAMGKFSRGGASHTKKRLRLDLTADIGDGMVLADLFDTSVSNLYRGYSRRVSGEVALAQYGVLGRKGLMELRKAAQATGAEARELKAFDQVASEFLNMPFGDLKVSNHKYMDNIRLATSLARLGGMGFTQLAEYGNAINAIGAKRMLSSVGDFKRIAGEIADINKGKPTLNPILKDLDLLGGHLGIDEYVNTRMFDVKDNSIQMYGTEQIGLGSRALRAGVNAQSVLSGHRMIMGTQVRGMAEQITRKSFAFIRDGKNDKALADMGITPELAARFRANMADIATWEKGSLMSVDLTKGDLTGHEIATFRDAVERGSAQIIQQTFIGETGIWAHDGLLKLLAQFRTFGITSIEKQWGRQYHTHGLKSFAYMVGAFSWAAPIYMARMQLKMSTMEESEANEYYDKHMTPMAIGLASLNYMSVTGLTSDVLDLGGGIMGGAFGVEMPDAIAARGQYRGGAIGGAIAPGVGLVNDVVGGVKDGQWGKVGKALPGANLPYVQAAVNGLTPD